MNEKLPKMVFVAVLLLLNASIAVATESAVEMKLVSPWTIDIGVSPLATHDGKKELKTAIRVPPSEWITVRGEKYDVLPLFQKKANGWQKGAPLKGLVAMECTSTDLLDPKSVQVRLTPDGQPLQLGVDYAMDPKWATVGRLPKGRIGEKQAVLIDYRYAPQRIDSIVLTQGDEIKLIPGTPHVAMPQLPKVGACERRLANVFIPGPMEKLSADHLYPILETEYPEPPKRKPSAAERLLPKTVKKLQSGEKLRILAWGDSVTDGGYLPVEQRWPAQFVERLKSKYPNANIELVVEAWPGYDTKAYLNEPAGSVHNYAEKVLARKPDLIVSEFVNDSGMTPNQVEERYSKFLEDFKRIGAEWIILTPHYVRPDWMGFKSQRNIDDDSRFYVIGLREFAAKHSVPLADASLRWGRLWRQGIPYNTLHTNTINHPNAQGMKLFPDSLMVLFP